MEQKPKQKFNFKKSFLMTMIISLTISAFIGIIIFLFGSFGDTEFRILLTTLSLAGFSLAGLCCSLLYEKRKYIKFSMFAIGSIILGFLFSILLIWEFVYFFRWGLELTIWAELFLTLLVLSFSFAHMSLILLINVKKKLDKYLLYLTLLFIAIVASMLIYLIFRIGINEPGELFFRLLGVFAILNVLGTIVTPMLNKIYTYEDKN